MFELGDFIKEKRESAGLSFKSLARHLVLVIQKS